MSDTFIEVSLSATDVAEAMQKDPDFAFEMFRELAWRLDAGSMLDDLCDGLMGRAGLSEANAKDCLAVARALQSAFTVALCTAERGCERYATEEDHG